MGIIKAIGQSISGVLEDAWLEFFTCDSLPDNILMTRVLPRYNSVNHGNPDIISNGSLIAIADGQAVIILEGGKILDCCTEPGEHRYQSASSPTLMGGGAVKEMVKDAWDRIGFGGDVARVQRLYYINTKEITGKPFATRSPIPIRIQDDNIHADLDLYVTASGMFSFRIVDPVLFYKNVLHREGTISYSAVEDLVLHQLLSCLMVTLPQVLSEYQVRPSSLITHLPSIEERLKSALTCRMSPYCGMEIRSMAFDSLSLTASDGRLFRNHQYVNMLKDPTMAKAALIEAQAQAYQLVGQNTAGALGLAVMNASKTWKCSCGEIVSTRFCPQCGARRP